MKRFPIALAAAVALLGTSAFAQEVVVNGSNVNQNVNAVGNVAAASGFLAEAKQSAGTITDTTINGSNVNQNVNAVGNVGAASGFLAETCQQFGSIGDTCD